jgi:hypothetical protein
MDHPEPSAEIPEPIKRAAQALVSLRGRPTMVLVAHPICGHPNHYLAPLRKLMATCESEELDLVIDSGGGDIKGAYLLIRELRRKFTRLAAFVPFWAKSAATLICLGADELVLGELGELGPLDVQVEERQKGDFPRFRSSLERFKALEQLQKHSLETFNIVVSTVLEASGMRPLDVCTIAAEFTARVCSPMYSQIDPDALGQNARDLEVGLQYATRVLNRYRSELPKDTRDEIARALVREYPSHNFPVDLEELEEIGLPARSATDKEAPILDELGAAIGSLEEGDLLCLFDAKRPARLEEAVGDADEGRADEPGGSATDIRRVK